jgi:hypothetical protein
MSDPVDVTPGARLEGFIAKYAPAIQADARVALVKMRALLPGAVEYVYDNYNALVVAFGASDRPSEVIASIALYPRWVTLFFADGAKLHDPAKRLAGTGGRVRSIRLNGPESLDEPDVRALVEAAIAGSVKPFDRTKPNRLVIQSISAKRRPRKT